MRNWGVAYKGSVKLIGNLCYLNMAGCRAAKLVLLSRRKAPCGSAGLAGGRNWRKTLVKWGITTGVIREKTFVYRA